MNDSITAKDEIKTEKATPSSENTGNLRQEVISGVSWMTLSQIIQQILQFGISVTLARLLAPRDFGLVATITVFTGFATLLGGFGLGTALIQRETVDDQHKSSVFWVNLFTGAIFALIFFLSAPAIAAFYSEPLLASLTRVMSLNFILNSLSTTQATLVRRSMNFRLLAVRNILGIVVSGACGIVLAINGYGVWSLVFNSLSGSFCTLILLWTATKWRPSFKFQRSAVAELWGFSSNMLGANILQYSTRNVDNLLIGRYLGSTALGLYARAYSIMLLPLTQITFVLQTVMFPALSKIQHDHKRTRQIYLRALSFIALLTFPLMLGLLVVSENFVLVLFTEKWAGMISTLQILCLVGLAQSLTSTTRWIYASQGRSDWMLRWGLFTTVVYILSFVPGIILGSIETLAIGYAVVNLLLLYWEFTIPGRLIGLRFSDVLHSTSGIIICSVAMMLTVSALNLVIMDSWPASYTLAGDCLVGFLTYLGLLHLFRLPAYREARALVTDQLQHAVAKLRMEHPTPGMIQQSSSRTFRK